MIRGCEWRHAPEACAEDFGRFEKVSELSSRSGRKRLTFACSPRPGGGCHTSFEADGKVSIERWYLSPYVEKPLNSKVIKSFVPELRSRKCFSCFGIPMFYIIYVMNILCLFHISTCGYVTFHHSICDKNENSILLDITFCLENIFKSQKK